MTEPLYLVLEFRAQLANNLQKIAEQASPFLIRDPPQVPVTLEKSPDFHQRWEAVLDNTGAYVDDLGQRVAVKRHCDQGGSLSEVNDVHWAAHNIACCMFIVAVRSKWLSFGDQLQSILWGWYLGKIRRNWREDVAKLAVQELILVKDQAMMTVLPSQTPYRYPVLPQEPPSIRLMVLRPSAERHGDIKCRLCNSTLDGSTGKYEALSYVWGNASKQRTIFVDNRPFQATENLESALRHLRYHDRNRILWVDSICINQNNIEEKTIQVKQMNSVYRNAQRVIIWLGPESEDSNHALDVLERLPLFDPADDSHKTGMPIHRGSIDAIYRLLERPWFKRAWCVQELILAKNAVFQCGQSTLSWEHFTSFVSSWLNTVVAIITDSQVNGTSSWERTAQCIRTITKLGQIKIDNDLDKKKKSVLILLTSFYEWASSDPKDKIFAFYSLVSDDHPDKRALEPDYDRDTAQVYTKVALHFIREHRNLNILSIATWPAMDFIDVSVLRLLPSWVPDWRFGQWFGISSDYVSIAFDSDGSTLNSFDTVYNASFNLEATPIEVHDHSQVLVLDGLNIDSIDSIGDVFSGGLREPKVKEYETICQWKTIAGLPEEYCYQYSGQTVHEAFWRTLLMDLHTNQVGSEGFFRRNRMPYENARLDRPPHFPPRSDNEMQDIEAITKGVFTMNGRRFFKTTKGLFGLAPANAKEGDYVVVLFGGKAPFILRKCSNTESYRLVGESYVHGIMDGEAIHQPPTEQFQHLKVETFHID